MRSPSITEPLLSATPPAQGTGASLRVARVHVPLVILVIIALACFLAPAILPIPSPIGGNVVDSNLPVLSGSHLLGTDQNGNDVLSRLLHGGRTSLIIALTVNLVGILFGGSLGAVSAWVGGIPDSLIMRSLDALLAFPSLVLVLAMTQGLGPGKASTTIALMLFSIPAFARVSRAATMRLRERPFMLAAQICGTHPVRILAAHLAPNIAPQLVSFGLLGIGICIIIEGGLSFLGLGVQPPDPSWGNMIALGQQMLTVRPYLLMVPSTALFVTVLCLNLLGEQLREQWSAR